jgi:hypothetical protein
MIANNKFENAAGPALSAALERVNARRGNEKAAGPALSAALERVNARRNTPMK